VTYWGREGQAAGIQRVLRNFCCQYTTLHQSLRSDWGTANT